MRGDDFVVSNAAYAYYSWSSCLLTILRVLPCGMEFDRGADIPFPAFVGCCIGEFCRYRRDGCVNDFGIGDIAFLQEDVLVP